MTVVVRPGIAPSRATVVGHDPRDSGIPGPTVPEKPGRWAICCSISRIPLRDLVVEEVWAQVEHAWTGYRTQCRTETGRLVSFAGKFLYR